MRISSSHKTIQRRNARYLRELRKRATPSELKVKEILDEIEIRYIFQKGFFNPFHRIVDFYIPVHGLIIEVDGDCHKETTWKDSNKDIAFLRKRGFKTLRILNRELDNIPLVKKKLMDFVGLCG